MADFSLGTAELGTAVDLEGLNSGLDEAAGETEGWSGKMDGFWSSAFSYLTGNILTAAFSKITGSIGGFFGGMISEAADAEEGMAQLDAVLASTAGKAGVTREAALELASSLSAANGLSKFSDDAILAGQNLLLTFTNIGADVFPEATQAAIDMAQAMGSDPQAQAIALGKALNDPIAGVSALSKVGVTFTDVQKASIEAMVESGDVAGAQRVILKELNGEFGGSAAAAADTYAGKMLTLKERFAGVQESIGTAVLPALTSILDLLMSPAVMSSVNAFVETITGTLGEVVNFITLNLLPGITSIGNILSLLSTGDFTGGIFGLAEDSPWINALFSARDAITGLGTAAAPVFAGIGEAIGLVLPFIAGLTTQVTSGFSEGGMGGAITSFIGILAQVSPAFAFIKTVVETALPAIKTIIETVFGIVAGFINTNGAEIIGFVTTTWGRIQTIIGQVAEIVGGIISTVFTVIAGFLKTHGDEIQETLTTVWKTIEGVITLALDIIENVIIPVLSAIGKFIGEHSAEIQTVLSAVWNVIKGTIEFTMGIIQGIIKTVSALIKGDWDGVWAGIKDTFGVVWTAMLAVVQVAIDAIKLALRLAWSAIKGAWDIVWGGIKTAWDTVWGGIQTTLDTALSTLSGALDTAWGAIKGAARTAWDAVAAIINGIWAGVTGTVKGAINEVIGFLNGVIAGANSISEPLGFGVIGTISYLAEGTPNWGGGLAIAGEAGIELATFPGGRQALLGAGMYDLPRGTQVLPADRTSAALAGNAAMRGGGGSGVNLSMPVTIIRNDVDEEMFAQRMVRRLREEQ